MFEGSVGAGIEFDGGIVDCLPGKIRKTGIRNKAPAKMAACIYRGGVSCLLRGVGFLEG